MLNYDSFDLIFQIDGANDAKNHKVWFITMTARLREF